MGILKLGIACSLLFFLTLGARVAQDIDHAALASASDKGSFSELQDLIDESPGTTINLTMDYLSDNGDFPEGIKINKSLTINGNNHIIDADFRSRIFLTSSSNDIVLSNIIFVNGKTDASGGAVKLEDGGKIINCTFISNHAADEGCAVYSMSNMRTENSAFENNSADIGGAISEWDSHVMDSVFTNNIALHDGGAIFSNYGSVLKSNFANNVAKGNGGAVYQLNGEVEMHGSVFMNNSAMHGGAIYQENGQTYSEGTFEGNHAEYCCDDICHTYNHTKYGPSDNTTHNDSVNSNPYKSLDTDSENSTGNPLDIDAVSVCSCFKD